MTASSSYAIPQKAPLKLLQESKKDKFEIIKENLSTTNFSKFAGDKKIKKAKSSIKKKLEQIRQEKTTMAHFQKQVPLVQCSQAIASVTGQNSVNKRNDAMLL